MFIDHLHSSIFNPTYSAELFVIVTNTEKPNNYCAFNTKNVYLILNLCYEVFFKGTIITSFLQSNLFTILHKIQTSHPAAMQIEARSFLNVHNSSVKVHFTSLIV